MTAGRFDSTAHARAMRGAGFWLDTSYDEFLVKAIETTPDKPALVAYRADRAEGISGQIFGVRNNEIYLFSQPRPIRTAHRGEGWTPRTVLDTALPMLRADFYALDRSADVFTWDPV